MGSYENIVKIEEMRKKVEAGDLLSAQKVLDTMDIKKIKNMSDLNLIAQVYTENERYEEASELYLKIYEKTKSRRSLFQLIEVLIKLNSIEDAEYFVKQYRKLAPEDFYNFVFQYKIDKIKGESFEHLIEILEELKKVEYTEKWAYELAKLYYKAGQEERCIRECSDIVLWFGEGTYVEKAKILRSYYSGETDKDRIMEEIKKRAEEVSSANDNQEQALDLAAEQEYEQDYEEETEISEASYEQEGNIFNGTDFMVQEDSNAFEDSLRRDIQSILTDQQEKETDDDSNSEYDQADTYYGEENFPESNSVDSIQKEMTYYEAEQEEDEDTRAFRKLEEETVSGKVSYDAVNSEEDLTAPEEGQIKSKENQVISLYSENQLQKEEKFDEEDQKLLKLSQVLQITPEELFGNFLQILSVKKQIVKSLEIINYESSKNVMMMITGTPGSGKTTLAKDFALYLYKADRLRSSKVAKIKADKLNTVDIMSKTETLKDCCLVIEGASGLKRQTIDGLLDLSRSLQGSLAIVFEEDKKNMNKLFRVCPKLMDLLKNRIHLPQYTTKDYIGFAYDCLRQKDYRINPDAEQVLQNSISRIVRQAQPHNHLAQINDLMQAVMNTADIRTGKQLSSLATEGRLKDVEVLTVLAEDFSDQTLN